MPQCVGIIGGKPNFALYFVGCQGDHLVFLDPHFVQEVTNTTSSDYSSYFPKPSRSAKMIHRSSLDPCLGVGLLIRNGKDLREVRDSFKGHNI